MKSRPVDRSLPFVFETICKVVAINYPNSPDSSSALEFCGPHWEYLLKQFFTQERFLRFVLGVDTDNGMTAKAIEVSFTYNTPDEIIKDICEEAVEYMRAKIKPIFACGQKAIVHTEDSEIKEWNGKELTIIGLDTDNDIDENGFRYLLKDNHGTIISVFERDLD